MSIKTELMQKNGVAAMKISRELITMSTGDRIDTIDSYSKRFSTSRGTIESVLKRMGDEKALSLDKRGHLGTFINYINYNKLWGFTNYGTLMGVMPLPYSKLYEGFATGLHNVIRKNSFPFGLAYMSGADTRIIVLQEERYDFAIVSKLAALYSISKGNDLDIVLEFGKHTYVNQHAIIFSNKNKKAIEDGMKIGIDRSSIDQYVLTLNQCINKNVQFVDLAYNQIISKLQKKEIDAAVWNVDEINEAKINLKYYKLNNIGDEDDTNAVLVVKKDNFGIKELIRKFINIEEVKEIQRKVVDDNLIPSY